MTSSEYLCITIIQVIKMCLKKLPSFPFDLYNAKTIAVDMHLLANQNFADPYKFIISMIS